MPLLVGEYYHCTLKDCDYKTKLKFNLLQHLGITHKYVYKFNKEDCSGKTDANNQMGTQNFDKIRSQKNLDPGQMGMTHGRMNVQHIIASQGQSIVSIKTTSSGQPPQQLMPPGPGAVLTNLPYGVHGQTRLGGTPGGNQRGGSGGKENHAVRAGEADLSSTLQEAGPPTTAGHMSAHSGHQDPGHQPSLYPGHPGQAHPVIKMVIQESGGHETVSTAEFVKVKNAEQRITLFRRDQVELGYRCPAGPGSGMINLNNTCYINATLQVSVRCKQLCKY